MSDKHQPVELKNATIKRGSTKAILVQFEHDGVVAEEWFPLSQVHDDSEIWSPGETGTLLVTHWIAAQKGLVEEDD